MRACVHTWRSVHVLGQETCTHQHDTKYRSSQIGVVPKAAGLSPPERRKQRERFAHVSQGHDDEAGDPDEL